MRNCGTDQGEQVVLEHGLIVEDLVREVDHLDQQALLALKNKGLYKDFYEYSFGFSLEAVDHLEDLVLHFTLILRAQKFTERMKSLQL